MSIAQVTSNNIRLHLEELESRCMLSGAQLFAGGDMSAVNGGMSTSNMNGLLTGAVFSTLGGFSGGGYAAGGGFATEVGFPNVSMPTGAGFSNGVFPTVPGFDVGANFTQNTPSRIVGVELPNGLLPNGTGLPDSVAVDELLDEGVDISSIGPDGAPSFSERNDRLAGAAPDAASGVGQQTIATGANTNGGTVSPTSGFSDRRTGTGGPVKPAPKEDEEAPGKEKKAKDEGESKPAPAPAAPSGTGAEVGDESSKLALEISLRSVRQG